MKTVAFLLAATVLATAADTPSLSGKWQVHNSIAGNESDHACTFVQKDDDLAGTCSVEKNEVKITGKIQGKKVKWTYTTEYDGSPVTLNYDGTVNAGGDKINGTVNVPEYSVDGDFTASQSK